MLKVPLVIDAAGAAEYVTSPPVTLPPAARVSEPDAQPPAPPKVGNRTPRALKRHVAPPRSEVSKDPVCRTPTSMPGKSGLIGVSVDRMSRSSVAATPVTRRL